jgi:hypothetical protein
VQPTKDTLIHLHAECRDDTSLHSVEKVHKIASSQRNHVVCSGFFFLSVGFDDSKIQSITFLVSQLVSFYFMFQLRPQGCLILSRTLTLTH